MGLKEIESKLPPGFRFYPSDEELVCHYLCKKISRERVWEGTLVEVDLHTCEPWELPEVAMLSTNEWYFFSFRDRKYSTGSRTNRATKTGYWKATGKDRNVHDPRTQAVVGMRKTLVFYRGRAPNGIKSCWVMHEFRLESPHMPPQEDWVLCRVFSKMKGEMGTSVQDNGQDNYTGYPSPSIVESSPIAMQSMQVDGYDQPATLTTFPTQQEDYDNNIDLARLQYNLLDFPAQEMQCSIQQNDISFAGFSGSRPEDDCGLLMNMVFGDHDMAGGSSSGHGIGTHTC